MKTIYALKFKVEQNQNYTYVYVIFNESHLCDENHLCAQILGRAKPKLYQCYVIFNENHLSVQI